MTLKVHSDIVIVCIVPHPNLRCIDLKKKIAVLLNSIKCVLLKIGQVCLNTSVCWVSYVCSPCVLRLQSFRVYKNDINKISWLPVIEGESVMSSGLE